MKRLRVAVLTHEDLMPPDSLEGLSPKQVQAVKREYGVVEALRELGHDVQVVGLSDELAPLRRVVEAWEPDVVFNLLMEFQDIGAYQVHVTSYLELLQVPYTGCNPSGILLTRDKALAKKIFRFHRIPTPDFAVFRRGHRVRQARSRPFPLIVKSLEEEASLGISQSSIVHDEAQLRERVAFVHERVATDAIVEQYVEGRELTISVLGNERLTTFPIWEMFFRNLPEGSAPIATARVKWDLAYQKRVGIDTGPAEGLPREVERRIPRIARRLYRALGLSGFARIDLRLDADGRLYVLEANATPDIARDEDFALSAERAGLSYPALVRRILTLGLRYRPPWKSIS